jgi:carbamoyl-phosphate synthase large subunit
MYNILITSAGRRVFLVKAFQSELKSLGIDGGVFTTDLDPSFSAASQVADKAFKVGLFSDPDYIASLLRLCIDQSIKLVIPTIDTELILLSKAKLQFAEHGIDVVVSDLSLITICRNKYLTNQFLRERSFLIPKSIDLNALTYPMFIKPVDGSSSKNLFLVLDETMLAPFMLDPAKFIHMEYISPKLHHEYSVDLYYNRNSELCSAVPRVRIETRGGEVSKGLTQKGSILQFIKETFSTLTGAVGCITLQLFENKENGAVYGIEINPRFGGGYPISFLAGANFPRLLLQEYCLNQVATYKEDWGDQHLVLRYDSEVVLANFDGSK